MHTQELGAELQRLLGVGVEGAGETVSGPSEALPGPFKPEKVDVSRSESSLMQVWKKAQSRTKATGQEPPWNSTGAGRGCGVFSVTCDLDLHWPSVFLFTPKTVLPEGSIWPQDKYQLGLAGGVLPPVQPLTLDRLGWNTVLSGQWTGSFCLHRHTSRVYTTLKSGASLDPVTVLFAAASLRGRRWAGWAVCKWGRRKWIPGAGEADAAPWRELLLGVGSGDGDGPQMLPPVWTQESLGQKLVRTQ